jgi:SPP1 family predicted phage head-tail adaptor
VKRLGEFANVGQEHRQYYNMRIGLHKDNYVDANSMTRLVGVYAPTRTSDGEGGFTTTFALQQTVWGDYRPQPQNRLNQESQLAFNRFAKMFIRYDITITDTYEFEVEGQRFTVHSIKDVDNAHRFWEIEMYA